MSKSKVKVEYFVRGNEVAGRARFRYMLVAASDPRPGFIRVNIVSMNPPNTEGEVPSGSNSIQTGDLQTAFDATMARLNSHHDGLVGTMSEIFQSE